MDIILGKFLAAGAFILIALTPTLLYPISISFLGDLDIGPVIGGYIGSVFLAGALTSIGLFASSLTKNQIVSLIIALAICFFLSFILGFMKSFAPAAMVGIIEFISADAHFNNIAKGVIDWRDILYFISIIVIALYSTKLVLERRK
jgi:ABC-2 type transport system permease protein